MARLEEEVGTAPITRLGRGVRLTAAGQALVEHADAVLTRLTAGFDPRIIYATDDYVTVQSLIAADLGVSLQPALALMAARRDDVAVRPVAGDPVRTVQVLMAAAERRPPAVLAMLAALREASADVAATPAAATLGIRTA